MAAVEECMAHAHECVRLAGPTDDLNIRDQLIDLARNWMAAALRERKDARVLPFPSPRS